MPVTQIPSRDPLTPTHSLRSTPEQRDLFEAQHWETAYRGFNPDDVPHLLIQLQDDLSRARKREALWLSVILHLLVIILLWNSEKLMGLLPHRTLDLAMTTANQSKDATFLELPPDAQKLTRRPDAKVISDKDRIATSKAPQISREDLKKLAEPASGASRSASAGAARAGPAATDGAEPATAGAAGEPAAGIRAAAANNQTSQLQTPPQTRPHAEFQYLDDGRVGD